LKVFTVTSKFTAEVQKHELNKTQRKRLEYFVLEIMQLPPNGASKFA